MGRMDRVNELIKRELCQLLRAELQDPRLEFVTITKVEVSPDLHNARVKFSVLGDSEQVRLVQQSLHHARSYIRKKIGKSIRLRFTPEFEFIYDPALEGSARLDHLFEEIHRMPPAKDPGDSSGH